MYKSFMLFVIIFILLCSYQVQSEDVLNCVANSTPAPASHPRDGRFLTAYGTLRVFPA